MTAKHIIRLLEKYIKDEIDENRVKDYVESLIALDLFEFDESDDALHDIIVNTVYTLDEIKDVNGEIPLEDAKGLLKGLQI